MITVKHLLTSNVSTSPDGKHWEPVLPDGEFIWWRVRLQDAIAVLLGEAIAIRQTTGADLKEQP